jgi:hypothetical protein
MNFPGGHFIKQVACAAAALNDATPTMRPNRLSFNERTMILFVYVRMMLWNNRNNATKKGQSRPINMNYDIKPCLRDASCFMVVSRRGKAVVRTAIQEATDNAAANGIANCQFVAASVEHIFHSGLVQNFPNDATAVIVDRLELDAMLNFCNS